MNIQSVIKHISYRQHHSCSSLVANNIIKIRRSNELCGKHLAYNSYCKRFSTSNDDEEKALNGKIKDETTSLQASLNWKKNQFDTITNKFQKKNSDDDDIVVINNDDELQDTWKQMESRVTRRRLPPKSNERGITKVGRRNIRKSEEDEWLKAGLYDEK